MKLEVQNQMLPLSLLWVSYLSISVSYLVVFLTEITRQPVDSINVIALEDVKLTCLASVEDVTYSWHRVGSSIPSKSIRKNNTLIIPKAIPFDAGKYYCMAKRGRITVQSNDAIVGVDGEELNQIV